MISKNSTETFWDNLIYFDRNEKWGDYKKMDKGLLYQLQELRDYVGRPVEIHCGYEKRGSGMHPKGLAVDVHIHDMSLLDQFLAASRFDFRGIGMYPYWNNPGLHLDVRESDMVALWGRDKDLNYTVLDTEFIKKHVIK